MSQRLTRPFLTDCCREIYARGPQLSMQQRLTTVYRPSYGAIDRVLESIPRRARLLDVGCGTGPLLFLASALLELERGYGFDLKRASIDVARAVESDAPLEFFCSADIPDDIVASCNAVTLVDLLHHVPASEKEVLLRHYFERMAPDSLLLVKDIDSRPRWRAFANRITDFISTRSLVSYLPMPRLLGLMTESGFEIVRAERWYNYVWCEYLVVGRKRALPAAVSTGPSAS
jgi:2-polyprenyl-3-methyl-5-hydroxy-6-metoxy-1,4-benzoquinol methylase